MVIQLFGVGYFAHIFLKVHLELVHLEMMSDFLKYENIYEEMTILFIFRILCL